MAALLACRLRVFLQVHLRHHAAAGVLHFQAAPVVHPQEERTGAVELFTVRSFRNGKVTVSTVSIRRRTGRSHGNFIVFVDFLER